MNGKLRNMATIYIKEDDKMLLLDRIGSKVVKRSWCGSGGHFTPDEINNAKINYDCDEGILEWISFDKVNNREMPFTAQRVMAHYLETGIHTNDFYSVTVDDENVNIIPLGVS